MENPFEPPRAEAMEYEPAKTGGSVVRSVLGVLLGGILVDHFGTHLIMDAIVAQLRSLPSLLNSMSVRILFLVCGIGFSFLGGVTAAWIARRRHISHALLGVVAAHALAWTELQRTGALFPIYTILMMAGCFAAAGVGGKIMAMREPMLAEEAF